LKKLQKYFPKNMLWKKYNPFLFAILLDPRAKLQMLDILGFTPQIKSDIRHALWAEFIK